MLKIYSVSFNDGGWVSSRPVYNVVASSPKEAEEMVLGEHPYYRNGYDVWCSEFKIDGYVIEVYDEKTYIRDKNLEKLL